MFITHPEATTQDVQIGCPLRSWLVNRNIVNCQTSVVSRGFSVSKEQCQ